MSVHYLNQVGRFVRLFGVAFLTAWGATGNSIHTDVIVGAVIGAAEVAYRQLSPVG